MDSNGTGHDMPGIRGSYADAYIRFLDTYNESVKNSMASKVRLKGKFFCALCFTMAGLALLFLIVMFLSFSLFTHMVDKDYASVSVITGAVAAILSSFATMAASILMLPQMVARYLFNQKEDDTMVGIIQGIQSYESHIEELEQMGQKAFSVLNHTKGRTVAVNDMAAMEDSPNNLGNPPIDEQGPLQGQEGGPVADGMGSAT